jgi:hypothetical protein
MQTTMQEKYNYKSNVLKKYLKKFLSIHENLFLFVLTKNNWGWS